MGGLGRLVERATELCQAATENPCRNEKRKTEGPLPNWKLLEGLGEILAHTRE